MAMTSAAKPGKRAVGVDALKLLAEDHKEVRGLFRDYQRLVAARAGASERQAQAEQICLLLTVHAAIEEEIFYPAARAAAVDAELLDEAEVEHASAKNLVARIRDMGPNEALYDATLAVLGEYIDHHVAEEQGAMFPKCRKSGMDLKALGAALRERKQALTAEMTEGLEVVG